MSEKQSIRTISFFRKIYFKIYDWFHPPPPIIYGHCTHCWQKYPDEAYFIEVKKFESVTTEIRNSEGEKIIDNLSWTVWLKICRYCGDIPNLRPQKIVVHTNVIQPIWQDSEGNIYEKFEIPKDVILKDVKEKRKKKP